MFLTQRVWDSQAPDKYNYQAIPKEIRDLVDGLVAIVNFGAIIENPEVEEAIKKIKDLGIKLVQE